MPFPVIPIAAGAIAGGALYNLIKGSPTSGVNKRIEEYYKNIQGRAAPQAGPASVADYSSFRQNQTDLLGRLDALSRGQGPSLAREQMRQATDRNMSQQASIAQSGRGNPALANIVAANASGRLGAQAASDSSRLAMEEQLGALSQIGGVAAQGRSADEEMNRFNALQSNYRDQANLEALLRSRGLDDNAIQSILQMQMQKAGMPSFGDKLMAGGAGMLALGATNRGMK
jgi:hypothetical protein